MMSVFCSNTLIFAAECWKCILRGPDFKLFPEGHAPRPPQGVPLGLASHAYGVSFFLLRLLQSFCHLLKTLLRTLQVVNESSYLQSRLLFHYRVRIKCVNGKLHKYRT